MTGARILFYTSDAVTPADCYGPLCELGGYQNIREILGFASLDQALEFARKDASELSAMVIEASFLTWEAIEAMLKDTDVDVPLYVTDSEANIVSAMDLWQAHVLGEDHAISQQLGA
jgi:hypothetical protein